MKLSAKGRYAVTAMVDLARVCGDRPVSLSDIALRQNLPLQFLEQLFSRLKKAGLVESVRGQKGGYVLALAAENISVASIVDAVQESMKTTACAPGALSGCRQGMSSRCLTHDLWASLEHQIQNYLSSISLLDICEKKISIPHTVAKDNTIFDEEAKRACP